MKNWLNIIELPFRYKYGTDSLSDSFLNLLEKKLNIDFVQKTGINPMNSKNIFHLNKPMNGDIYDQTNSPFQLKTRIMVLFYGIDATIKWRSLSGKAYYPSSTDIDPDDIEFWFEDLNVKKIQDEYKTLPPPKLWFKHKKTPYELIVGHLIVSGINLVILLNENKKESSISDISSFIDNIVFQFNEESEKKGRRYGVIHDAGLKSSNESGLEYLIDYGSANNTPLRRIIEGLSDFDEIRSVELA